MFQKIYITKDVSIDESLAIKSLVAASEKDGTTHKLDLGYLGGVTYTKHLLLWNDDQLIGYACLCSFNENELEAAIVSNGNKEIFEAIAKYLNTYAKEQNFKQIIFIADHASSLLKSILTETNCKYAFSEAYLELSFDNFSKATAEAITLTKSSPEEKAELERFLSVWGKFDLSSKDLATALLHKENSDILACIRVYENEQVYGIYGFLVREDLRGRGIGRRVLYATILDIMKKNPKAIFLEVETKNMNAFHLYESLGFVQTRGFDYYIHNTAE